MKTKRLHLLSLLLPLLLCPLSAFGVSTIVDNLKYEIDLSTNEATVTGPAVPRIKDLVIPDFITYEGKDYPVTAIGNYAFYDCYNLTGLLTIGDSMKYIGNFAFYRCSWLYGSLIIPNLVEYVGHGAFGGCSLFTGSLTIGESVQFIGDLAFEWCSGFTGSLIIPNSVLSIGAEAFAGCSGFDDLFFSGSINLGGYVFYNTKFKKIYFSEQVEEITIKGSGLLGGVETIEKIICEGTTPPSIGPNGYYLFDSSTIYNNAQLIVPEGSVNLYKTAYEWEKFDKISSIDDYNGVGSIVADGSVENWVKNPDGCIAIDFEAAADTHVGIYTTSGVCVRSEDIAGGTHFSANIDSQQIVPGLYIVVITADGASMSKKVIVK